MQQNADQSTERNTQESTERSTLRSTESCMDQCLLCPRECKAARSKGQKGICHAAGTLLVARAALHYWEEPCLSGSRGSGAVFFSGCPLQCVYCQNRQISRGEYGEEISIGRLADIFLELQEQGANNINLVTAGHFLPHVVRALEQAKNRGLDIPVVYNSSGYEKVQSLRMLEGLVDIYLPDLKYLTPALAREYSRAADYPGTACAAIREMVRQQPFCEFSKPSDRTSERPSCDSSKPSGRTSVQPEDGSAVLMKRGVIVRHLVLPGHVKEAKAILKYLHDSYGNQIWISIMNQYTPQEAVKSDLLLGRRVTAREYERVLSYALELGIDQAFYQEGDTAKESFVPVFDGTGV